MARCFIIEPTELDVNKASRFGELVTLFPANRWRPSVFEPAFADAVVGRLNEEGFDPKVDYVVLTGKQLTLVVAVANVGAAFGPFNVLAYNAHGTVRDYEPVVIGTAITV